MSMKKNKKQKKQRKRGQYKHSIVHIRQNLMPDEVDVPLVYVATRYMSMATTAGAIVRWQPNAAYDVDPLLGSTSTSGFAEWAAFYTYYRVTAYQVVYEVANAEAFDIYVFFLNTNTDPGTNITNIAQFSTHPYCRRTICAAISGGRTIVKDRQRLTVAKILGSQAVQQADSLRSLTNGVPADLIWTGVGCEATGSNLFTTAGVNVLVSIKMFVKFYGRVEGLSSLLERAKRVEDERRSFELKKALNLSCGKANSSSS